MKNSIIKIVLVILAFAMLSSCSAPQNAVDNIVEGKPVEDSRYLLFSTQAGGELSHWSFESVYNGFCDSANANGIEVKKVVFSDVRTESGMQGMYAHFCDPLHEEIKSGNAKGLFSLELPVGAFPYYESYTENFPTLMFLSANISVCVYPSSVNALCYPTSGVEKSHIAADYITANYGEKLVIGSIWNVGALNTTAVYGDKEFFSLLEGKAELVEPMYLGSAKGSEGATLIENYCKDNNVDILVTSSVVSAECLINCDTDIIYIGINEEAIESVKTGDIKAVICTDPYAVGEIAYENLMKIINGEDFEEEICIEPILIDTAEEAEDFLKRNSQN